LSIKGINCLSLFASDLERNNRFYAETLGWALSTDEPGVAGVAFGDSCFVIHSDDRGNPDHRTAGGIHALVKVERDRCRARSSHIAGVAVTELRDQSWVQRTFTFTDSGGYLWVYVEETRTHS
jgi:catechol 2,3-dioxygenase-like lactoylglutathione lyase family enzyme